MKKQRKKKLIAVVIVALVSLLIFGYIKFFNGTFIYISTGFGKDGLLKTGNKKASVMEEYIAPNRKRIPYGMMNFAVIRRDDCYYVDKTRFIPIIEDADKFFFFIRPRRFGKSLTVSMLQHYYDVNARDKFDALFGDLYIGQHPTKDRNSYLVLKLNFSLVSSELHNYLYTYLLNTYDEAELSFSSYEKSEPGYLS